MQNATAEGLVCCFDVGRGELLIFAPLTQRLLLSVRDWLALHVVLGE